MPEGKGTVAEKGAVEKGPVGKAPVAGKGPATVRTLRRTIRPPERILQMGIGGAGKSYDGLTIVSRVKADTCWLIDTDASFERMIQLEFSESIGIRQSFSGWTENRGDKEHGGEMNEDVELPVDPNGQVVLFDCQGKGALLYRQIRWAIQYAIRHAKPHDWIMVDSMTLAWDRIKSFFVEAIHGTAMGAFFMSVREKIKVKNERATSRDEEQHNFNAFEGWIDYQPINQLWEEDIRDFLKFPTCNIYVTTEMDTIGKDEKDKGTLDMYGRFGVKPRCQKKVGHDTATVIMKRRAQRGEDRFMTTIKDKGRPEMEDTAMTEEFVDQYLIGFGAAAMVEVPA